MVVATFHVMLLRAIGIAVVLVAASCCTHLVRNICYAEACCENDLQDGLEVDVDCGYKCRQKCGAGDHCVLSEDCRAGYKCTKDEVIEDRVCVAVEVDFPAGW